MVLRRAHSEPKVERVSMVVDHIPDSPETGVVYVLSSVEQPRSLPDGFLAELREAGASEDLVKAASASVGAQATE
jgi:hypothetical protein